MRILSEDKYVGKARQKVGYENKSDAFLPSITSTPGPSMVCNHLEVEFESDSITSECDNTEMSNKTMTSRVDMLVKII